MCVVQIAWHQSPWFSRHWLSSSHQIRQSRICRWPFANIHQWNLTRCAQRHIVLSFRVYKTHFHWSFHREHNTSFFFDFGKQDNNDVVTVDKIFETFQDKCFAVISCNSKQLLPEARKLLVRFSVWVSVASKLHTRITYISLLRVTYISLLLIHAALVKARASYSLRA